MVATGAVGSASEATEAALLNMLDRPPAQSAPDADVCAQLRALALGAAIAGGPGAAPIHSLRSDTVLKAGKRFGEDWSLYLDGSFRPTIGVVSEIPLDESLRTRSAARP